MLRLPSESIRMLTIRLHVRDRFHAGGLTCLPDPNPTPHKPAKTSGYLQGEAHMIDVHGAKADRLY